MLLTPQSKKIDHNTKINEFEKKITDDDHDKYITSPKCFPARLKEAKVKAISATELKKDLINKLSILNGRKYFKIIQQLYQLKID